MTFVLTVILVGLLIVAVIHRGYVEGKHEHKDKNRSKKS